jgi:hypothetical protein
MLLSQKGINELRDIYECVTDFRGTDANLQEKYGIVAPAEVLTYIMEKLGEQR